MESSTPRLQVLLEQVQRQRKLLRRKNRRLGRMVRQAQKFVDNVSHEFRTPLTVIKEYTSLLHEGLIGDVNAEQRRMLQIVEDRADDLTTMVDDMLDISKLEAGLLGAWRKPCRVEDIFDRLRPSLERKAIVKGVTLELAIPAGLPDVYCDEEKAGRIVTNLAVNAIKFCGDPGVVRISCRENQPRREVVIDVADNGPGIAPESIALIFERFKQLAPSSRGSTKGFGLGLNIARELAELNYGELRVASELGVGSTFSCVLPVSDSVEVMRRHLELVRRRTQKGVGSRLPERPAGCFVPHPAGFPIALLVVHVPESTPLALSGDVDAFLNFLLRRDDLLFRTGDRAWLLALPKPAAGIDVYVRQMQQAHQAANRNRPHGPLPSLSASLLGAWDAVAEQDLLLAAVCELNGRDLEKLTYTSSAETFSR